MNYDNYHARDIESGNAFRIVNGTDNRVCIMVPPDFEGSIHVTYEFPILWKIAYSISAISVFLIVVAVVVDGRKKLNIMIPGSKGQEIRCKLACKRIFELGTRKNTEK